MHVTKMICRFLITQWKIQGIISGVLLIDTLCFCYTKLKVLISKCKVKVYIYYNSLLQLYIQQNRFQSIYGNFDNPIYSQDVPIQQQTYRVS